MAHMCAEYVWCKVEIEKRKGENSVWGRSSEVSSLRQQAVSKTNVIEASEA